MTVQSAKRRVESVEVCSADAGNGKKIGATMPAVVIGSNPFFKEGLRSVLMNKVRISTEIETLEDLARLDSPAEWSLIVVDCESEADMALATTAIGKLRGDGSSVNIIVLAGPDLAGTTSLAKLGAVNAIVRRDISREALLKLLDVVAENFTILSKGLLPDTGLAPVAEPVPTPAAAPEQGEERPCLATGRPLSDRELAILRCLVNGESNKAIARRLEIAEATVKIHVKGVLRKISVSNRTQAAIWALKHLAPTQAKTASPAPSAVALMGALRTNGVLSPSAGVGAIGLSS